VLNEDQTQKVAEYVMSCRLPELARFNEKKVAELLNVDSSNISIEDLILREKVHRSLYIIENSDDITTEELAQVLGFANTEEFVHLFEQNLLIAPERYIFIVKNRNILKCV
jgi:AraC-like DNA-binding protein